MTPRGKNMLALIVAFGLGGVAGAFGMRATQLDRVGRLMDRPTPEARRNFMVEVMRRRLDLTPEQADGVRKVFEAHEGERKQAFDKCRPEHEALKIKMTEEIDALLTPQQREKHKQLQEELESRRRGKDKS
ncbi:MAG: hypothetical protein AB7S68_40485 [Polyangiaceae bacterium]